MVIQFCWNSSSPSVLRSAHPPLLFSTCFWLLLEIISLSVLNYLIPPFLPILPCSLFILLYTAHSSLSLEALRLCMRVKWPSARLRSQVEALAPSPACVTVGQKSRQHCSFNSSPNSIELGLPKATKSFERQKRMVKGGEGGQIGQCMAGGN
jgi:hypothetical protein